jgi:hypothetical protein
VKSKANVHLRDEDGVSHEFQVGDELPEWALKQVKDNPYVVGRPAPAKKG